VSITNTLAYKENGVSDYDLNQLWIFAPMKHSLI
jgi:hypothetical protein